MRFHLVTVEGTQQQGQTWTVAPTIPLRGLIERGPNLMMPMAGEELELRLPDGHVVTGIIAGFGVDVWKDSEGKLWTNMDPSDPALTLTISCDTDVSAVPPGTEVWLKDAKPSSTSEEAS
jgi:hypothetical protein